MKNQKMYEADDKMISIIRDNRFTPTDLLLPATTRPLQKNSGLPVYQQFCRYATNSHIT